MAIGTNPVFAAAQQSLDASAPTPPPMPQLTTATQDVKPTHWVAGFG